MRRINYYGNWRRICPAKLKTIPISFEQDGLGVPALVCFDKFEAVKASDISCIVLHDQGFVNLQRDLTSLRKG